MYYLKRIISAAVTIFSISIFLFILLQVVPGDPVLSKLGADEIDNNPELALKLREKFELDKPVTQRYINWLQNALKGNLGDSFKYDSYTVNELIGQRITVTLVLTLLSLVVIILTGIPMGLFLAKKEGTGIGDISNIFSQISLALPSFWVAIILLGVFGSQLKWFPIRGKVDFSNILYSLKSLVLPVVTMSIGGIASVARYLKTSLIEEQDKDYVTVAKSKGLLENEIMRKHIFRNSLIPVSTIIGLIFIGLMTGSIIVENVFSLAGIGSLLITAINSSDYPVVQGIVLYYSIIVVAVSLVLDIVYSIIDPRIKLGRAGDKK